MNKVIKKIRDKQDINELLFAIIMFSGVLTFFTQNMFSENVYSIIYKVLIILCIFVSCIANRWHIIKKSDLIMGFILVFMFGIDYLFRKNGLTINTYLDFIILCCVPCYFLRRVTDYDLTIKYMSVIGKFSLIFYLFDALFGYYFTVNYMSYGFGAILPSFFAVYIGFIKNRRKTDLIYLLLGFVAIVVYSNRTCLLSTICLMIFTFFYLFSKKKRKNKKSENNIKKGVIVISLFALGFAFNYSYHNYNKIINIFKTQEEIKEEKNIGPNSSANTSDSNSGNVDTSKKDSSTNTNDGNDISFNSYSIDKYSEGFVNVSDIFSGRVEIYEKAINVIKKDILSSPMTILFGRGTGYFRSINDRVYTHCIIFDLIIEYGFVGLIIMLGILVYCFLKLLKNRKNEDFYLIGCMFLFIAFPKLLLSTMFQKEYCLWLFIVLILYKYPIRIRKK